MAAPSIAQLSARLTDSIAYVELERSTLDEVIVQLAEQATHLNRVAGVLTEASHSQGLVLHELQRLMHSSGATAGASKNDLQPAAQNLQ
eukprot:1957163-Prymnesium_polylepis.1